MLACSSSLLQFDKHISSLFIDLTRELRRRRRLWYDAYCYLHIIITYGLLYDGARWTSSTWRWIVDGCALLAILDELKCLEWRRRRRRRMQRNKMSAAPANNRRSLSMEGKAGQEATEPPPPLSPTAPPPPPLPPLPPPPPPPHSRLRRDAHCTPDDCTFICRVNACLCESVQWIATRHMQNIYGEDSVLHSSA